MGQPGDMAGARPSSTHHGVSLLQLKIANVLAFVLMQLGAVVFWGGNVRPARPLIQPGGAALAIWLPIYAVDVAFLVYQFSWPKADEALLLHGVGFWYIGACACNGLWISTWSSSPAAIWGGTGLMFVLLFSLCKCYVNTGCWRTPRGRSRNEAALQALLIDVHFSMYASWVALAAIINVAVALTTVWTFEPAAASAWTVAMLVVALLLDAFIVVTRRDCVWGLVLAWASFWIYFKQSGSEDAVAFAALAVCVLIALLSALVGSRAVARFKARNRDGGGEEHAGAAPAAVAPSPPSAPRGAAVLHPVVDETVHLA